MPAVSLTFNRISTYPGRSVSSWSSLSGMNKIMPNENQAKAGKISSNAKKRIRNACTWLVANSAKRNIKQANGKFISNFKVSFVTLTLPTKQQHTHKEIKSKCLNLFLTQMRQKCKIQNYIWKAELQENGNIHFHLTFDKYVHYMIIRKYWNSAIGKLGYIGAYAQKFRTMSEADYIQHRGAKSVDEVKKAKKAYVYGIATNWQSPNTTDVHSVQKIKNFASYMAKYMTKDNVLTEEQKEAEAVTGKLSGRLWFLSTSLSKLSSVKLTWSYEVRELFHRLKKAKGAKEVIYDWCRSVYFQVSNCSAKLKRLIEENIFSYVLESGYVFPSVIPRSGIKPPTSVIINGVECFA